MAHGCYKWLRPAQPINGHINVSCRITNAFLADRSGAVDHSAVDLEARAAAVSGRHGDRLFPQSGGR